jgi:hypothetical protein
VKLDRKRPRLPKRKPKKRPRKRPPAYYGEDQERKRDQLLDERERAEWAD